MNGLNQQITFGQVIRIGGGRTHRPFPIKCAERDVPFKTWDIDIAMSVRVGDCVLVKQGKIIKILRC